MGGCVPRHTDLAEAPRGIPSRTGQRVDTVAGSHADRDLLFEALAVHLGFVARDAPEEARRARPDDADPNAGFAPSLAEILVARTSWPPTAARSWTGWWTTSWRGTAAT